jgi:uncharacterized membrane protein YeaQ/YmgE (transglycosylase-associated protein family)
MSQKAMRAPLTPQKARAGLRSHYYNLQPVLCQHSQSHYLIVASPAEYGRRVTRNYDLGPGTQLGAIGGIVGAFIIQALIPAIRGIDYGPIIGQLIVAGVGGAALTAIAAAAQVRRRRRR